MEVVLVSAAGATALGIAAGLMGAAYKRRSQQMLEFRKGPPPGLAPQHSERGPVVAGNCDLPTAVGPGAGAADALVPWDAAGRPAKVRRLGSHPGQEERMHHMAMADALSTARRDVEARAAAFQADSQAVKRAEDELSQAIEAKNQKGMELRAMKREFDEVGMLMQGSFAVLQHGAWAVPEEGKRHVAALLEVCRSAGLEAGFLEELPRVAMKRPAKRGAQDHLLFRALEAGLHQRKFVLEGMLGHCSKEALVVIEAVPQANRALEAARERQRSSYEALRSVIQAQKDLEKAAPRDLPTPLRNNSTRLSLLATPSASKAGVTPPTHPRPAALKDTSPSSKGAQNTPGPTAHDGVLEAPLLIPFWEEEEQQQHDNEQRQQQRLQRQEQRPPQQLEKPQGQEQQPRQPLAKHQKPQPSRPPELVQLREMPQRLQPPEQQQKQKAKQEGGAVRDGDSSAPGTATSPSRAAAA